MGTPGNYNAAFFCANPQDEWVEQIKEDMYYDGIERTQDRDSEGWSDYYSTAGGPDGTSI